MATATEKELARVRRSLEKAELVAGDLRDRRNRLLLQAMESDGKTEREAAELAGVSPTYAHRVKRYAGKPPSGPMMERQAA